MGTTTTNLSLYKPTVGETGWGTLVNANFDTLDAVGYLGDDYSITLVGSTVTAYDSNGLVAFSGADLGAVLTSCVSALASAEGNPVGSIAIGPGNYTYTTKVNIPPVVAAAGVAQDLNPGWLRIHGSGRSTRITNGFSSGNASFLWFNRGADYDSFGHIEVTDLLWNANDKVGFYSFIGNYDGTTTSRKRVNILGVHCYRLEMINAPTCFVGPGHVGLAWLVSDHLGSGEATQNYINDIVFEDCVGVDNGNYFIAIGGAGVTTDVNVLCDNIHLTRCRHTMFHALVDGDQVGNTATLTVKADPTMENYGLFDPTARFPASGKITLRQQNASGGSLVDLVYTGKTATTLTGCSGGSGASTFKSGTPVGFPISDNYIIGTYGHVGKLRITDCVGGYSGDNSLEIDNATDVVVKGYVTENNDNQCITIVNNSVPRINYATQRLVFEDCVMRRTLPDLVSRLVGIFATTAGHNIKDIQFIRPQFHISQDRNYDSLGGCIFTNGSGTPALLNNLTVIDPTVYWSTGGIASLATSTIPTAFWLYSGAASARYTIRGGSMYFTGAAPTLNGFTYNPVGVDVGGTGPYIDFDFEFKNDVGSSAPNWKGAVALGNLAATSPRGRIRVTCPLYSNDSAAKLIYLDGGCTLDASHRLAVTADASALPSGGTVLHNNGANNNLAYVKMRDTTYQNSDVRPAPSGLTGLVTATGKLVGTPHQVMAAFIQGSGAAITKIEVSTDAGTTYTTALQQSSGAMPTGPDLLVGPLWGDALIKVTFTTTQPTITLIPV